MTEAEWLACEDPRVMLQSVRGPVNDRKLRLLIAESCRLHCYESVGDDVKKIVTSTEALADSKIDGARSLARLVPILRAVRGEVSWGC